MKREYKEYIEREAAKARLRIWITDCVYARPLKDMNYDYLCRYWNGHSCNQNQFCSQGKKGECNNYLKR